MLFAAVATMIAVQWRGRGSPFAQYREITPSRWR